MVHQPAVGEHVQRGVGRGNLHGRQRVPPVVAHFLQRRGRRNRTPETLHKRACVLKIAAEAQTEHDLALFAILQLESSLDGGAGIHARTQSAGQARSRHRRRVTQGPVATDEFAAVAGYAARTGIGVEEGHAIRELHVVGVAGEQGATGAIGLGDQMHRMLRSQVAQHPFGVGGR